MYCRVAMNLKVAETQCQASYIQQMAGDRRDIEGLRFFILGGEIFSGGAAFF
ncbi:MAG: hypothetical protein AAF316_17200 [Cyanobacteria bacterium P01_A01_bin.80]